MAGEPNCSAWEPRLKLKSFEVRLCGVGSGRVGSGPFDHESNYESCNHVCKDNASSHTEPCPPPPPALSP